MDGHVVAYRTPFVSNACDAYRELFSRMNSGTAISSLDYPGVSVKAESLVMRTSKGKAGNVAHEIQAFGTPHGTQSRTIWAVNDLPHKRKSAGIAAGTEREGEVK